MKIIEWSRIPLNLSVKCMSKWSLGLSSEKNAIRCARKKKPTILPQKSVSEMSLCLNGDEAPNNSIQLITSAYGIAKKKKNQLSIFKAKPNDCIIMCQLCNSHTLRFCGLKLETHFWIVCVFGVKVQMGSQVNFECFVCKFYRQKSKAFIIKRRSQLKLPCKQTPTTTTKQTPNFQQNKHSRT